jgi:molybdopterin-guanine dinucleotide biosynthesis protein
LIVVVAGQWRKAGKTTVVCEIIAATREANWSAVKVTPEKHVAADGGDTARYIAAGAAAAYLIEGSALAELPAAENLLVESNAILAQVDPDLVVFVEADHGEWKASARDAATRADYIVRGHATPELLDAVGARLNAPRS